MEPNYVGANGRIDSMAVAWLLDEDHVFFLDGEITWDGHNHGFTGAQVNAGNMDEVPVFMSNYETLLNGVLDLMMTLEKDESLRFPRDAINPALHEAIRDGDLTGITLFNLIACGHAIKILNPQEGEYRVIYDNRLARGIPAFYKLVSRMIWDMREYNGVTSAFQIAFASARNIDADQYLRDFDGMVPGAVSEAIWMEQVDSAPCVELPAEFEGSEVEAEEAPADADESDGEIDDRAAMASMLRLFVLTGELGGNAKFPQELLDELDRAENGDESIDLDDLASRLNECVPESRLADLSSISFEKGLTAKGRRFTVAVPDGWTVIENYEETTLLGSNTRPFVIVQGEPDDKSNLQMLDRIIYSDIGGDVEVAEAYAECGTHDLKWALALMARYDKSDSDGLMGMRPNVVWDDEVEAVNTRCFVSQNQPNEGSNGLELYVNPYALDHNDALRFVFTYDGEESVEPVRELAKAIARTVKLDKPVIPECEQTLAKALAGKISIKAFVGMVESFAKPYVGLRQSVFTSHQYKYATNTDNFDDDECTLAGARGIAEFGKRATPVFAKLLDAYEVQVKSGVSAASAKKMLSSLVDFEKAVFPNPDIFDGETSKLVKRANVFELGGDLAKIRKRLDTLKADAASSAKKQQQAKKPKAFDKAKAAKTASAGQGKEKPAEQPDDPKETPEQRKARIKLLIIDCAAKLAKQKEPIISEVVDSQKGGPKNLVLSAKEVEAQFDELVKDDKLCVIWGKYHTNRYSSAAMVHKRYRWHLEHPGEVPKDVAKMDAAERMELAHEQAMFQFESIKNNSGTGKYILDGREPNIVDLLVRTGGAVTMKEICVELSNVVRGEGLSATPGEMHWIAADCIKRLISSGLVVEAGGKYYLWTQHDSDGKPLKDDKFAITAARKLMGELERCEANSLRLPELEEKVVQLESEVESLEAKVKSFGFFGGGAEKKQTKARLKEARSQLEETRREKTQAAESKKELGKLRKDCEALDNSKSRYRWY